MGYLGHWFGADIGHWFGFVNSAPPVIVKAPIAQLELSQLYLGWYDYSS